MLPRSLAVIAFAAVAFAASAAAASASTLVYQCGSAVCAIDPDAGGEPRRLADEARLAGITADGRTASWVAPGGRLVQAPVRGGAPRTVPFEGAVGNQPLLSPDGTQYLWWFPGPDVFGGLTAIYISRLTVGQPATDGLSYCGGCVTSHGWLKRTPIAAFPADTAPGEPSQVCRLATEAEEPGVSRSCVQVLARDDRGGIAFPDGNAAGTEIVAAMTPGEATGVAGRIVRYSLASGQPIADVTAGTVDTTPVFSAEGDRVAFERSDQIVVKDLVSGAERTIGPGTYPHWGGPRTAPRPRVARTLRARALRSGRAAVRVSCPRACRVQAALEVRRATARRLDLGRRRTIAAASTSRRSAGTARLRLRATRRARTRLTRLRAYPATLRVTVRLDGSEPLRSTNRVRVRR